MARKRYKPEEIVAKRRTAEVLPVEGTSRVDAVRQMEIREVTLYRWRKEDGGRGGGQLRRSKVREKEHERLRRTISDRTLDTQILTDAAQGHV